MIERLKNMVSGAINFASMLFVRFLQRNKTSESDRGIKENSGFKRLEPQFNQVFEGAKQINSGYENKTVKLSDPCPRCGRVCDVSEIDEVFGYRNMKVKDRAGSVKKIVRRQQSYCRHCRVEHSQLMQQSVPEKVVEIELGKAVEEDVEADIELVVKIQMHEETIGPLSENTQVKGKDKNDISITEQRTTQSEGKESDKRIPDSSKPDSNDLHQETGPTNPATEMATSHHEDNEWTEDQLLDVGLEGESQTEDSINNRSEAVGKPKRQPTKYQPSIRTPDATQRARKDKTNQTEAISSRLQTLRMHLHIMLGRRNQFRMSLLPERTEDIEEEIEIIDPDGQITTWSACQDEWYSNVVPPKFGNLLVNGADWESHSEVDQLRWVLSGREIYVLASSSAGTISGYIPVSRLILFEDHLVLCTIEQEENVRQALVDAGCSDLTYVPDGSGIPEGWVLFQSVHPTVAIAHDDSGGIITILRPIEDIEIVFRGGIRLNHSIWLNAHPPAIFTRGADNKELEVMIDGNTAHSDETGKYTIDNWDTPGQHTVFCGGVTQSYELVDATNEWELFNAFSYVPNTKSERTVTICGPVISPGTESEFMSLVTCDNTCLIGAVPGQITLLSTNSVIRRGDRLAVTNYPIVWALPPNPFTCNKSSSYVKMISCENTVKNIDARNKKAKLNILRWCDAILNSSRRQLRVEPATEEAQQLWEVYKIIARRYWRDLR